jgi:hypothetical protein
MYMSSDQIVNEIEAFEQMRDDLEKHHMGKHVVIKGGELQGAFDTFDTAARDALQKFGRGPFLIRQVGGPECMRMPASVAWHPVNASR